MFTGIIETTGRIKSIKEEGSNLIFSIESSISPKLKPDQSVSHSGVCLTVVEVKKKTHRVILVQETLKRSNLSHMREGDEINLERAMKLNSLVDGHLVQGHIDQVAVCKSIEELNGSKIFHFEFLANPLHVLISKGSVALNGVSLTVIKPEANHFSVSVIPYTLEHTTFKNMKVSDMVNIEFDMIGKYVEKIATGK